MKRREMNDVPSMVTLLEDAWSIDDEMASSSTIYNKDRTAKWTKVHQEIAIRQIAHRIPSPLL
jgi:hypothetical protein